MLGNKQRSEHMNGFKKINTLAGWMVFLFALVVYVLTLEPTVSFWDCGEFISAAYKLEVVHPPGSPMHMLTGRFFSLFAPGLQYVAYMINFLSALTSAFTILFMFWTLTYLMRKVYKAGQEYDRLDTLLVIGSAVIAALSATFLDSFWFSAVEGEVYAYSAFFFFAIVWAMIRWDAAADTPYADRWLILIGFLVGLGLGVHLLHLLALPALAYIYYFRKYKPSPKGFLITFFVGFGLLAFVMWGVLDYFIKIAVKLDILFVNSFGLPFNSGVIFFLLLVFGLGIYFISFAKKRKKPALWTGILAFLMLIIGLSSYSTVMSRAKANPPINMNEPADIARLYSYLKREQYGSRPLIYGPTFMAQPLDQKVTGTRYQADFDAGKYIEIGKKTEYVFDVSKIEDRLRASIRQGNPNASEAQINNLLNSYRKKNKKMLFPRMGSLMNNDHARQYRKWLNLKEGEVPGFGDNMRFFFDYQIGYMYFRYFMWNFSGRQDNLQGHIDRGLKNGNWLTGIRFLDVMRLGKSKLDDPESKNNPARNNFYMLPFLLGLLGLVYNYKKNKQVFTVLMVLFFFSGIMLIINANEPPSEPRERDYALALSFITYAMWIGMGVLALFEFLREKMSRKAALAASLAVSAIVPLIMGFQGWDDHDRSGRYVARDSAWNYLESLAPNAILFTQGDNDTYPLWYIQEVEHVRPDVRIINLSLLAVDWYIDQLNNRINDAPPLKLTFNKRDYMGDGLIQTPIQKSKRFINKYGYDLPTVLKYVRQQSRTGERAIIPVKKFTVKVDSARAARAGLIPEKYANYVVPQIEGKLRGNSIFRDELMILDIIASNYPERPIYYSITVDPAKQLGLGKYLQREGLGYRLMAVAPPSNAGGNGFVNTDLMYDNITQKWKFGNVDKKKMFMEEWTDRTVRMLRGNLIYLANVMEVANESKEKRKDLLRMTWEKFPSWNVPYYDPNELYPVLSLSVNAGDDSLVPVVIEEMIRVLKEDIAYNYDAGDMEVNRSKYGGGARDFLFKVSSQQGQSLSVHGRQLLRDVSLINTIASQLEDKGKSEWLDAFKKGINALEEEYNMQLINPDLMNVSGG